MLTCFLAALPGAARGNEPVEIPPAGCPAGAFAPDVAPAPRPPLPAGGVPVPFRNTGGHILVPVRVNGATEVLMVLDTGMSAPIVLMHDKAATGTARLEGGQPVQIGGAGLDAPVTGRMVARVPVAIGDLELPSETVILTGELCGSSPLALNGVIGKSVFDRYAVDIDFERSVLMIHEASRVGGEGMVNLPLLLQSGIPTIAAVVEDGLGQPVPVRLVVDLGARHALSLVPGEATGIRLPARVLETIVGRGIQGEVPGAVGRIRGLRLGPLYLRDVVSSFAPQPAGLTCAGDGTAAGGNLGVEILRRFRVVVDYPGRRLLLAPRDDYDRPFEFNMAGLSLEQSQDGSFLIRSVVEDSPGAAAGLVRGDRIVAIDDRPLEADDQAGTAALFHRAGARLRLTVQRGETRFARTLTLRRLV